MGAFAGFTSARLYKTFKGDDVDDHPFIYLPTYDHADDNHAAFDDDYDDDHADDDDDVDDGGDGPSIYLLIHLSIYLYIYLLLIRQAMAEVHSPHGLPISRHPLQCILHPRRPRVGLWVRV